MAFEAMLQQEETDIPSAFFAPPDQDLVKSMAVDFAGFRYLLQLSWNGKVCRTVYGENRNRLIREMHNNVRLYDVNGAVIVNRDHQSRQN